MYKIFIRNRNACTILHCFPLCAQHKLRDLNVFSSQLGPISLDYFILLLFLPSSLSYLPFFLPSNALRNLLPVLNKTNWTERSGAPSVTLNYQGKLCHPLSTTYTIPICILCILYSACDEFSSLCNNRLMIKYRLFLIVQYSEFTHLLILIRFECFESGQSWKSWSSCVHPSFGGFRPVVCNARVSLTTR